ncbi:MAG: type II toxin-antitoxin system prevent-host-death family antitoxin [Desulfovibrio sp.]|nr:type II toxin-antitoxin system prevent-host-death family antitoxin [Desulfovibrio sp.]
MQISLRDLVSDPAKYVLLAGTQDIYITQEGKKLAKLTGIKSDKAEIARSLFGILPQDIDITSIKDDYLR